jgi:hypothetical protein
VAQVIDNSTLANCLADKNPPKSYKNPRIFRRVLTICCGRVYGKRISGDRA